MSYLFLLMRIHGIEKLNDSLDRGPQEIFLVRIPWLRLKESVSQPFFFPTDFVDMTFLRRGFVV